MDQLPDQTIAELRELAAKIEDYPIGHFANEKTRGIFLLDFWKLANKFVANLRLLSNERIDSMIASLNTEPTEPADAFHLHVKLVGVVPVLRNHLDLIVNRGGPSRPFVDPEIIRELRETAIPKLDLGKLIRMCEELNECYGRENHLACALLIRAALNHVPPVFGFTSFKEVVSQSGRSVKAALELLEDDARIVADLHTHLLMRARESLPTRGQIEPFRASFEILLHEVVARAPRRKP